MKKNLNLILETISITAVSLMAVLFMVALCLGVAGFSVGASVCWLGGAFSFVVSLIPFFFKS